jgi:hypothetical protein
MAGRPTAGIRVGPLRVPDARRCGLMPRVFKGEQKSNHFMTIEAAHARPMHRNLAAVEADLALRRAPAVAHPASAAAVRRACELLPVLAQHLFDGSNPSRQTEALK